MNKWQEMFDSWRQDVLSLRSRHLKSWVRLGLGDPDVFVARDPVVRVGTPIYSQPDCFPFDLLDFYRATNGWPLWLGPNECEIAPWGQISSFMEKHPEQYATVMRSSFGSGQVPITHHDEVLTLDGSLILSTPIAREIVLSCKGRLVLFCYDYVEVFPSMYAFLQEMKGRLLDELESLIA